MKCRFYLQAPDRPPADLGVFEFSDEAQARQIASERLSSEPAGSAIDVWADRGELFRISSPGPPDAA